MSKDLVKWKPPRDVRVSTVDRALQLIPSKKQVELTPLSGGGRLIQPPRCHVAPKTAPDDVLDLIRHCTVHQALPYISRYIQDQRFFSLRRFHYAQSIRVTEAMARSQYQASRQVVIESNIACEEEQCAICFATGLGAIHCGVCDRFMCWGKVVNRRFRCASDCKAEGPLTEDHLRFKGFLPSVGL